MRNMRVGVAFLALMTSQSATALAQTSQQKCATALTEVRDESSRFLKNSHITDHTLPLAISSGKVAIDPALNAQTTLTFMSSIASAKDEEIRTACANATANNLAEIKKFQNDIPLAESTIGMALTAK